MSFTSLHDFLYMGGHYAFVWSAYGVGLVGIAVTLARPLRARRRFFAEQAQRLRRQSANPSSSSTSHTGTDDASRPA